MGTILQLVVMQLLLLLMMLLLMVLHDSADGRLWVEVHANSGSSGIGAQALGMGKREVRGRMGLGTVVVVIIIVVVVVRWWVVGWGLGWEGWVAAAVVMIPAGVLSQIHTVFMTMLGQEVGCLLGGSRRGGSSNGSSGSSCCS